MGGWELGVGGGGRLRVGACGDQHPCALQVELPTGLSVVPGPAGGEGCSLQGGCASCPYMKMNSLQALMTGGWPGPGASCGCLWARRCWSREGRG